MNFKVKSVSSESDEKINIRPPFFLQKWAVENSFQNSSDIQIPDKYSQKIEVKSGLLSIDADLMRRLVGKTVDDIVKFTVDKLKDFNQNDVSVFILIGGLSELCMLKEAIKREFPSMTLLTPPEYITLIGDFVFGHIQIERLR